MALTGGQKFCLWLVILGALAIIAGAAAPFWVVYDAGVIKTAFGAWYACVETALTSGYDCQTYTWTALSFDDFGVWFYVFHGASGLATLISIILVIVCLPKVCGDTDSAKGAAGVALIAGLLGVGSAVLFYLKTADSMMNSLLSDGENLGWAFFVFASGTGFMAFFSMVLLCLPNASSTMVGPM